MHTHLAAAIACLQKQIENAEQNAPIHDAEGRHDEAFAAREVAASCRLAVARLMAEDDLRPHGEALANARHDFSAFVYLFALRD